MCLVTFPTPELIRTLRSSRRVSCEVYSTIRELGICARKPTKRGTKGFGRGKIPVRIANRKAGYNTTTNGVHSNNLVQVPLSKCTKSSRCMNLTLMNARSVSNKALRISEYIIDNKVDILAVTETWLKQGDGSTIDDICPPSYRFLGIPRPTSKGHRGGGVGIVIRSNIDAQVTSGGTYDTFESFCVLIKGKRPLNVCVIYRPPPSSKNGLTAGKFMKEIEEFLSQMCTSVTGDICIVGDFNLHYEISNDPVVKQFCDILTTLGLKQWVKNSTHKSGHLLDLVITRNEECHPLIYTTQVTDAGISDHCAVTCTLSMEPSQPTKKHIICRTIRKVNSELFANDLSQNLVAVTSDMDVNTIASNYVHVTRDVMDKHAPLRKITIKGGTNKSWYNDDIHEARVERRRLERQYKKSGLQVHKELWERQSQLVIHKIKECKQLYYQDKLGKNSDSNQTFALINGLMNCNSGPTLPTSSSDQHLADAFVQYFKEKVASIRTALDQTHKDRDIQVISETSPPTLCHFESQTQEDILKIIKKCATKSCSLDSIPTTLLKNKHVLYTVLPTLTSMINSSITSGVFPECLKQAQVTPLIKKQGLDANDFKSYRPISNLPFLSKVIEKVISHQINRHLSENNIHDQLQSAYKKGTSTETALLRIKADIEHVLDDGDGILLVLLDLSAAFDTIDHGILLQRLKDNVGLHDTALQWMRSYLTNRKQAVCIHDCTSRSVDLSIGVPQGSVLGPLLFLIYILPLKQVIEKYSVWRHGFADDTQIYNRLSLKNENKCADQIDVMEQCLSDIRSWMLTNKLKLNESKTEVIVIANRSNIKLSGNIKVKIGEEVISPKQMVRNLGGTFDSMLSMEKHVNIVAKNAYYHLRRLAKIRHFLTKDACAAAINATVTSRLDFHNGLLLGTSEKFLRKLQLVQNSAARLLTGTNKREHITPVLQSLHWLPISHRIQFKVLVTIHKALYSDTAPAYVVELCTKYKPNRQLRSSADHWRLEVSRALNHYGARSLPVLGAQLWNKLPKELRTISSPKVFRKCLKTVLFKEVY